MDISAAKNLEIAMMILVSFMHDKVSFVPCLVHVLLSQWPNLQSWSCIMWHSLHVISSA